MRPQWTVARQLGQCLWRTAGQARGAVLGAIVLLPGGVARAQAGAPELQAPAELRGPAAPQNGIDLRGSQAATPEPRAPAPAAAGTEIDSGAEAATGETATPSSYFVEPAEAPASAAGPAQASQAAPEPATTVPNAPPQEPRAAGAPASFVKAVPRRASLKHRRIELSPAAGLSLTDTSYQHFVAEGSVVYYPHDSFAIGIGANAFYAHVNSADVAAIRQSLLSVPAVFALPTLFAHVDAYWRPIYGKVSFYQAAIAPFDLFVVAGVGVATAFNGRAPLSVNIGIGQHYDLNRFLALRLTLRDYAFVDTALANNIERSSVQNYLLLTAGLSFFVPPSFEYSTP